MVVHVRLVERADLDVLKKEVRINVLQERKLKVVPFAVLSAPHFADGSHPFLAAIEVLL